MKYHYFMFLYLFDGAGAGTGSAVPAALASGVGRLPVDSQGRSS